MGGVATIMPRQGTPAVGTNMEGDGATTVAPGPGEVPTTALPLAAAAPSSDEAVPRDLASAPTLPLLQENGASEGEQMDHQQQPQVPVAPADAAPAPSAMEVDQQGSR